MKRDGIWYFHKFVNGKREFNGRKTPFSLETSDLNLAIAKRNAILRAASGSEIDRVMGKQTRAYCKLHEIFSAYTRSPTVRANPKTRQRNLADLERMVRVVKGAKCDVQELSSTELTWQLVEQWQMTRMALAKETCGDNLAAFESAKRTLNSLLVSIQSVFSKQARSSYRALHLPPNIEDFATALPVQARRQEAPVHLTDSFVLKLFEASTDLRAADPGAWVAFQLMAWGGLRNNEACHARRSWLLKGMNGYELTVCASAGFVPKGNSRTVVIPREVASGILQLQPTTASDDGAIDDHLVPATSRTDREDACYRRLNDWLREQGVEAEVGKVSYRLRKYFLKKVAVQQHPLMAQSAGGHSTLSTTQDHYIGKPKMTEPIRLPVDLAKLLSFVATEVPPASAVAPGAILTLAQAAQLLEVPAADLAARAEKAESVMLDGYVFTVRREGGMNGKLTPAPTN